MFDLGDVVTLTFDTTDSSGVAADAGSVTVTIGLPDGTSVTPVPANPAVGRYQADYTPAQTGRHSVRWVATGVNASAYTDMFDVADAAPAMIVSLAAAKRKCKIPDNITDHDDTLRGYIEAVTMVVEDHLHEAVVRRIVVEDLRVEWADEVVLGTTPVISLTSVATVDGTTSWDIADLHVDTSTGIVSRLTGASRLHGLIRFIYSAGRMRVPANYSTAGLIIIEHLWQTERPQSSRAAPPFAGGGYEDSMSSTFSGFAIPNRAIELLGRPPVMGG